MFTIIVALRRCEILENSTPLRVIVPGPALNFHQLITRDGNLCDLPLDVLNWNIA